jgi:hypothetical protein
MCDGEIGPYRGAGLNVGPLYTGPNVLYTKARLETEVLLLTIRVKDKQMQ